MEIIFIEFRLFDFHFGYPGLVLQNGLRNVFFQTLERIAGVDKHLNDIRNPEISEMKNRSTPGLEYHGQVFDDTLPELFLLRNLIKIGVVDIGWL
jgi:hypothetical protein